MNVNATSLRRYTLFLRFRNLKRPSIAKALFLTGILCAFQHVEAQSTRQLQKAWGLADQQAQLLYKELQLLKKRDSSLVSPRTLSTDNELVAVKRGDWTSGFFPGVLWFLYEKSGKQQWKIGRAHV